MTFRQGELEFELNLNNKSKEKDGAGVVAAGAASQAPLSLLFSAQSISWMRLVLYNEGFAYQRPGSCKKRC